MSNGRDERLWHVAEVWALAVDEVADEAVVAAIREHRFSKWLLESSDDVLLEAALLAREPRSGRSWHLPLIAWEQAAWAIQSSRPDPARNPAAFENALLPKLRPRTVTDIAAIRLLEGRARDRAIHRSIGDVYRPKRIPVREIAGLRDVDADEVETAAVLLLARTAPDGQFASTGTGQVFVGLHRGFHKERERVYVDGLTAGLDDARDLVDDHREGHWPPGGRFYVHDDGGVECALCRCLIAKVTKPRAQLRITLCTGRRDD